MKTLQEEERKAKRAYDDIIRTKTLKEDIKASGKRKAYLVDLDNKLEDAMLKKELEAMEL